MYNFNIYENKTKDQKSISTFCEGYKTFISKIKTERLAFLEIEKIAISNGFKTLDSFKHICPGDKILFKNKGKNIILCKIGKKDIVEGINILGAHIDSTRIDLKPNPLYEKRGFALFDTQYYGMLKKYQYVARPLAIHGVVCRKDGAKISVDIGESANEPVFGISDLLIHLSAGQITKPTEKAIDGEKLDVILGSIYTSDDYKKSVKDNILNLIKEKYKVTEEDLISSEIEIVPAGEARDFGLDRSMIAAYGQDDRACVYTSLKAILDSSICEKTQCCLFVDKEEINSVGNTSADSLFFENTILELLNKTNKDSLFNLSKCFANSFMLCCDVGAAIDPLYEGESDINNSGRFNYGILMQKYVGGIGKSNASDANAEAVAKLRNIFDKNNIHYQVGVLGLVDRGVGGSMACKFAKYNMDVVDVGLPILNMHSPMEIAAKADVYETYLAYKVFLESN